MRRQSFIVATFDAGSREKTANMEQIGVIGVGRMGLAMVKHLIKHGYKVTVCDIDRNNLNKAAELGAMAASTPAELAKRTTFVILGVGYDEEVREVTLGKEGVLQTLAKTSVIAVSSTVAPDTVKELDAAARAKGLEVLDAPICRGREYR
jgi:3-hydroxyisobutyrate dehydrogenase-like beta-hydroxyacid dehydrogenase